MTFKDEAHKRRNQDDSWMQGLEDNNRLNNYSLFLLDGDFEYWQPLVYMDKNTVEYKIRLLRSLWIQNRFTEFKSRAWEGLDNQIKELVLFLKQKKLKWTGDF